MEKKIEKFFDTYAPIENAETWDNTGTLISSKFEDNKSKIMLTIDLTNKVLDEAILKKCGMIIAYHPVIFNKLNRITDEKLLKIIQNNISVYCPHTALDNKMCRRISEILGNVTVFEDFKTFILCKSNSNLSLKNFFDSVSKNLYIKKDQDVIFRCVLPDFVESNMLNKYTVEHVLIGVGAAQPDFKNVISDLNKKNQNKNTEDEKRTGENESLEKNYNKHNSRDSKQMEEALIKTEKITDQDFIDKNTIKSLNLIITGEMRHHDMLFYRENNTCVILLEHSNIERFYCKYLKEDLKKVFPKVKFYVSHEDNDPVIFYHRIRINN
ncbi:hypothetical protein EDEG_03409 [Edhazardia aedis USNM 41457]|uniref:YbgI/family dinuclear metal center protein n=1 Tax=Edhazardia aedis (strain USNM 41457) TaxID=1003232 RepID=J9D2V7_EDHAE|nr:hypothetical protein EDEG_03409 [Edhazardia aedis USNM 41457]|eukprot:EJW02141.1 hypothetical protein EDEG_03409 [Edhazardia aedis USNM 41457]